MHYNMERRRPFGVRWQPALPKRGEGGSAAATPPWVERSDGAISNSRILFNGLLCNPTLTRPDAALVPSRICGRQTGFRFRSATV